MRRGFVLMTEPQHLASERAMYKPHDPPRAVELVEAVREFLRDDVMPATEGRVQFHARVAANVLEIVERELRLGQDQEREHHERLAGLGYEDDVALARAIRDGDLDYRDPDLVQAVKAATRAKLEVARPRYLEHP